MVRNLQLSSGAKIQIRRDSEADPNAALRPVEIIGSLASIEKAEKLINEVIAQSEGGGVPALFVRAAPEQIEIKVPNDKYSLVGVIIGRGGETIKNMQTSQSHGFRSTDEGIWHLSLTLAGSCSRIQGHHIILVVITRLLTNHEDPVVRLNGVVHVVLMGPIQCHTIIIMVDHTRLMVHITDLPTPAVILHNICLRGVDMVLVGNKGLHILVHMIITVDKDLKTQVLCPTMLLSYTQAGGQQNYGQMYDQPNYDNPPMQQSYGGYQQGYPPAGGQHQTMQQPSRPYGMQGPAEQGYGPPRPAAPSVDVPYQGPPQAAPSYGANMAPPQQQYGYASSTPGQQTYPSYNSAAPSHSDGYNSTQAAAVTPAYEQHGGTPASGVHKLQLDMGKHLKPVVIAHIPLHSRLMVTPRLRAMETMATALSILAMEVETHQHMRHLLAKPLTPRLHLPRRDMISLQLSQQAMQLLQEQHSEVVVSSSNQSV
ncbi:hypothetical protein HID58_037094 [Brassica napus]|uniref:K Homology domain-containing protein n=1 Tax=Brassica napus TaxID=3708 RepID=A0ABQ7XIG6_BRANA|nr:hypothetical protein HID58_037094 [Brassica napus]